VVAALPAYGSNHFIFEYFHFTKVKHYEIFHTAQKEYGTVHYVVERERICTWAEVALKVATFLFLAIPIVILQYLLQPKGHFELWTRDRHFQIEDIQRLAGQSIGLRHVSSHDQATVESTIGISLGCAFNLTFQRAENKFVRLPEQLADPALPENAKLKLVYSYEQAVNGHFSNSFTYDAGLLSIGQEFAPLLDKLNQSSFMVIDYSNGSNMPVDFIPWSGLGRFPKCSVYPEQIRASMMPSLNDRLRSERITSKVVGVQFIDSVLDTWRKNLLEILRKLE
jgi:hypothetical protein